MKKREKKIVGWREWVALPELGISKIKAKVDTGARSSSLHAVHLRYTEEEGQTIVQFDVHPLQRSSGSTVHCRIPVLEFRNVKSSSGHEERRPVVLTHVELMGERFAIEMTLTNRDSMGFRMLLGRESLRGRFLVDPGHSFMGDKKTKMKEKIS